jgi:hypothetical protein
MNLKLLEKLKDKLITAREFGDVMKYFLDHFGEDPAFIALGDRIEHPFLEAVLAQVGQQLFGKPVSLTDVLLTRLPEHAFIHGGASLGGKLATVLYFEDLCKGLLTVCWSITPPETKYARFTGRPMLDSWKRSDN